MQDINIGSLAAIPSPENPMQYSLPHRSAGRSERPLPPVQPDARWVGMGIPSYLKASCVSITPEDPPKVHQPPGIRQKGVGVFVKPPKFIRRGEALKRPSAFVSQAQTHLAPAAFLHLHLHLHVHLHLRSTFNLNQYLWSTSIPLDILQSSSLW
jgi:hypothetical protein